MDAGSAKGKDYEARTFPNGDTYTGGLKEGVPEGEGTYKWADDSIYSGQWVKGRRSGVGKYRWPSGAIYQGEWVDDMMQGVGTFEAPDGTTYAGSWWQNRKHGLGKKIYANHDRYEGLWRNGKAWGPGRYVWIDGNEYDGEWANGVMHGAGTFVWHTGERYDGEWQRGLENGQGIFTWADGSSFDGFMLRGRKHGIGLYRMPPAKPGAVVTAKAPIHSTMEDAPEPSGASASSPRCSILTAAERSGAEDLDAPLAAPKAARRRGDAGGVPSAQAASVEVMYVREYDRGREVRTVALQGPETAMLASLVGETQVPSKRKVFHGKTAKLGETINAEHRSYELMLDLQLGVRYSVSRASPFPAPKGLQPQHFCEKVKSDFPRVGSADTPPHPNGDFRWKDYAPAAFRKLRALFVVDPGEYMLSICGEQALRELSSPGKSGALFYISHDDRFLIKTMRRNEMQTFLRMLPAYYEHVATNPHTLLTKFYGLYRIQMRGKAGRKMRFIVMGNIFNAGVPIHQQYDLKGSRQGRTVRDKARALIWKDLDLDVELQLPAGWKARLDRQLTADATFLRAQHVMDYSMLMGIHFKNRDQEHVADGAAEKAGAEIVETKRHYMAKIMSWNLPDAKAKDIIFIVHAQLRRKQKRAQIIADAAKHRGRNVGNEELAFQLGEKRVQLGVGMEARAIHKDSGIAEDVVVYFGIIDYLQAYSSFKKAEHAMKSVRYDGKSISVVNPDLYAQRFTDFMQESVFR